MEFTVLFVVLLLGVGIPLRNKAIKEYRKKKGQGQQSSKAHNGNITVDSELGKGSVFNITFLNSDKITKL